jgi:SAM-dependent methyltransferase
MYHPHMGILPRNQKAAATWDSAGEDYERVSLQLADAVDETVALLAPRPGERILDIGTGTGLAARRAAALGAQVVGIDIGAELIETARRLAGQEGRRIEFRVADAEKLPFEDNGFDGILSTFGIMFAGHPEEAACELARVCREGGRIALASWAPYSSVAAKFEVHRPYLPPSTTPSPFEWGIADFLLDLLGGAFDLRFETGISTLRLSTSEEAWDLFSRGYGPTRALAESLPQARREEFRRDFLAYYEGYRSKSGGIQVPREYLVAVGTKCSEPGA